MNYDLIAYVVFRALDADSEAEITTMNERLLRVPFSRYSTEQ